MTSLRQQDAPTRKGLFRISDLARETGVPVGTIKFYMREGMLPPPTLKTGRNMAYYDRTFVERIRCIRELQQKRFLPLDVIKAILDGNSAVISPREIETLLALEGNFYESVHYAPGHKPLTRAEVTERYLVDEEKIQSLVEAGVLTPTTRNGKDIFEGEDVLMLETLEALREAGFSDEIIPQETALPIYVEALSKLASQELKLFSRGVTGKVDDAKLAEMALAGIRGVEQFIVLLRRKLILRAIQELREESSTESTGTDD
jgi:DNA-binding transcriptional MerR regulator